MTSRFNSTSHCLEEQIVDDFLKNSFHLSSLHTESHEQKPIEEISPNKIMSTLFTENLVRVTKIQKNNNWR